LAQQIEPLIIRDANENFHGPLTQKTFPAARANYYYFVTGFADPQITFWGEFCLMTDISLDFEAVVSY